MNVILENKFLLMLGGYKKIWLNGKREMSNLMLGSTNTYMMKMLEKSTEVGYLKLWNIKATIIGSIRKMQM